MSKVIYSSGGHHRRAKVAVGRVGSGSEVFFADPEPDPGQKFFESVTFDPNLSMTRGRVREGVGSEVDQGQTPEPTGKIK